MSETKIEKVEVPFDSSSTSDAAVVLFAFFPLFHVRLAKVLPQGDQLGHVPSELGNDLGIGVTLSPCTELILRRNEDRPRESVAIGPVIPRAMKRG